MDLEGGIPTTLMYRYSRRKSDSRSDENSQSSKLFFILNNYNFILNVIFFNFAIYFFVIKVATVLLFYFSLGQLNDSRIEKDDSLKGNIGKKDTNDGEGIFFIFSIFYFILNH